VLQRFRIVSTLTSMAIASLASGCGGGGSDTGTPPPTTTIAKTATNSGEAQSGSVGQPLGSPLQVLVTDGGTPSSGVTVAWSAATGGGTLDPASAVTDANGVAASAWTLGTVSGTQTARAALTGAAGSPVTFTATAAPGPAAALAKVGGDQQVGIINAPLADPLVAKVQDDFGNGVPGVDVTWAAVGGTVSSGTVPTDAGGISQVQLNLGPTEGTVTVTASAAGLTPISFAATAVAPSPLPTTAAVRVGNIFFGSNLNGTQNPAVDTVAVGGTVTWTWVSNSPHSVQSTGSPSFLSSSVKNVGGSTYAVTFPTAGTYQYDCSIHGTQMTGRIVVR
jgi:plastocyanin